MLRPAYLRQKLTRPLPTKDGGVLWTIADARVSMLALSKERALHQHWQDERGDGRAGEAAHKRSMRHDEWSSLCFVGGLPARSVTAIL
jgi:hypothetical protein